MYIRNDTGKWQTPAVPSADSGVLAGHVLNLVDTGTTQNLRGF